MKKKIIIICILTILLIGCKKNTKEFIIIDNTEICAEALEEIYRDDNYKYSLPCIKSDNITIQFKDGKEYKLKEVLDNNILTIDELINKGLKVYKDKI